MKKLIGGLLLIGLVLLIAGCSDCPSKPPMERIIADTHKEVVQSLNLTQEEYAQNRIAELHTRINQLTGWNAIDEFNDPASKAWKVLDDPKGYMTWVPSTVESLVDLVEVESVHNDLRAFLCLLTYAVEERNVDALRYAHRIIHDLDYWVFNLSFNRVPPDYWKATTTLEGDSTTILQWISQNIDRKEE